MINLIQGVGLALLLMMAGAYMHQQAVNNGYMHGQLHVNFEYPEK